MAAGEEMQFEAPAAGPEGGIGAGTQPAEDPTATGAAPQEGSLHAARRWTAGVIGPMAAQAATLGHQAQANVAHLANTVHDTLHQQFGSTENARRVVGLAAAAAGTAVLYMLLHNWKSSSTPSA